MAKSDFVPPQDPAFIAWHDNLLSQLDSRFADLGLSTEDLTTLRNDNTLLHAKIAAANAAAAVAKHATAEKNEMRHAVENHCRAIAKRIKAHPAYNSAAGALFGIEGAESNHDVRAAKPNLSGADHTAGQVELDFSKLKSEGINLYSQREGDSDWVLLARITSAPYIDNRPLLQPGKPELRRYTAVYVVKDQEVGAFSDEVVVNCAP